MRTAYIVSRPVLYMTTVFAWYPWVRGARERLVKRLRRGDVPREVLLDGEAPLLPLGPALGLRPRHRGAQASAAAALVYRVDLAQIRAVVEPVEPFSARHRLLIQMIRQKLQRAGQPGHVVRVLGVGAAEDRREDVRRDVEAADVLDGAGHAGEEPRVAGDRAVRRVHGVDDAADFRGEIAAVAGERGAHDEAAHAVGHDDALLGGGVRFQGVEQELLELGAAVGVRLSPVVAEGVHGALGARRVELGLEPHEDGPVEAPRHARPVALHPEVTLDLVERRRVRLLELPLRRLVDAAVPGDVALGAAVELRHERRRGGHRERGSVGLHAGLATRHPAQHRQVRVRVPGARGAEVEPRPHHAGYDDDRRARAGDRVAAVAPVALDRFAAHRTPPLTRKLPCIVRHASSSAGAAATGALPYAVTTRPGASSTLSLRTTIARARSPASSSRHSPSQPAMTGLDTRSVLALATR